MNYNLTGGCERRKLKIKNQIRNNAKNNVRIPGGDFTPVARISRRPEAAVILLGGGLLTYEAKEHRGQHQQQRARTCASVTLHQIAN